MNKYQEFYLKRILRFNVISEKAVVKTVFDSSGKTIQERDREKGTNGCTFENGVYTIYQNDNFYLKKYLVGVCSAVDCDVYLLINGKKVPVESDKENPENHLFILDFDNRAESIIIEFNTKLIDTIIIPIVYVESDKAARDKKIEEERIINDNKLVDINVVPGDSFVNVIYKSLNESYEYAEADLYMISGVGNNSTTYFLATYKANSKTYFINIPNLSYGNYEIVLRQYDGNGNVIFASNKVKFKFDKPHDDSDGRRIIIPGR